MIRKIYFARGKSLQTCFKKRKYLPRIWISFHKFLPVFTPPVTIIDYIHFTASLNNVSWFTRRLHRWSHVITRRYFFLPVAEQLHNDQLYVELNIEYKLRRCLIFTYRLFELRPPLLSPSSPGLSGFRTVSCELPPADTTVAELRLSDGTIDWHASPSAVDFSPSANYVTN